MGDLKKWGDPSNGGGGGGGDDLEMGGGRLKPLYGI